MSKRRITKGQGGGGGANFNDSKKTDIQKFIFVNCSS
jgi:hypothetical protein